MYIMLIQFYIIVQLLAVGLLYFGVKEKKWLLTFISTILFLVLALQAFQIEVVSGGVTLVFQEIVIVMLNWAGGFIALALTLLGMIKYVRDQLREKKGQG